MFTGFVKELKSIGLTTLVEQLVPKTISPPYNTSYYDKNLCKVSSRASLKSLNQKKTLHCYSHADTTIKDRSC